MQNSDAVPRDQAWLADFNRRAPAHHVLVSEGQCAFGGDSILRFRLANGLSVLLLVDKSAPVVAYHTWMRVGSRHESPGKTGLSHFFEHLMFNETENLPHGEFDRLMEESGAESNAATWVDWTFYHELLPRDRVELAIRLESERMGRLILRDKQVSSEREVVANERRQRVDDDVEGFASELLYHLALGDHPCGHPTIGWMQDIEKYCPADCEEFYRTYYAPNNATVILAGDIDPEVVLPQMAEAYGYLRSVEIPRERDVLPPVLEADKRVEIKKPTSSEKLLLGWVGPAIGDPDHLTLGLLSEILSGGRASRLQQKLLIEKELLTEVRTSVSSFSLPGLFEVYASAREGVTADTLLDAIDDELRLLGRVGVTKDELERACARSELGLLQSLETVSGRAEQIGFFETVLGNPSACFDRMAALRKVTEEDIRDVANRYLMLRHRTIVIVRVDESDEEGQES